MAAYDMRVRLQAGQVHQREYAGAIAPLLEYESKKDKKVA